MGKGTGEGCSESDVTQGCALEAVVKIHLVLDTGRLGHSCPHPPKAAF